MKALIFICIYLILQFVSLILLRYFLTSAFPQGRQKFGGAVGSDMVADLSCFTELGIKSGAYRKRAAFFAFDVTTAASGIFLVLAAIPLIGALIPDSRIKFMLQAAGNIWQGYYIFMFSLLLIVFVVIKVSAFINEKRHGHNPYFDAGHPSARTSKAALAISLILAVTVNFIGYRTAKNVKITEYDVAINGAGSYKIALMADLHLGVNSSAAHIEAAVDAVNSGNPDLILIGGDFFSSSYSGMGEPAKYESVLSRLKGKDGVYGVWGNHDVEEPLIGGFSTIPISESHRSPEMEAFAKNSGITMLNDELVNIAGNSMILAGRKSSMTTGDEMIKRMSVGELIGAPGKQPLIVLEHEPNELKALSEAGADLVLSGHTHNGQIFPGNLVAALFNDNVYGEKTYGNMSSIVTSGVGYYGPPIRLVTVSEVVFININNNK